MVPFAAMDSRHAAPQRGAVPQPFVPVTPDGFASARWQTAASLLWAGTASTLHRVRRCEGALLAVNLSLIAYRGLSRPLALVEALISMLAIGVMYAFNDWHDAPTDSNNPKKDAALIGVYLEHRRISLAAIFLLKLVTLALALAFLSPHASLAVAAVMSANVVYSIALKGVPVVDVVWCGIWGAAYAAIVTANPAFWVIVALMTAVCHLYQALDDRGADAANAITTTAVRSPLLSTGVLTALCISLVIALRPPFGAAWAWTALLPLAIYFACREARTGWLLTKAYFAVMWLAVLGLDRALR